MNRQLQEKMAQLPEALLPWYEKNARHLPWRENRDPYRVWLSEIMLQQTRVEAVKGYYIRFLETFPDIASLAAADNGQLLKLWEGLGYYSRARNLKKAAQMIISQFGGVFPRQYEDILSLPGIGDYTAGAIASICFEQPTPAVDGNVLRVIARVGALKEEIDLPSVKKEVASSLAKIYPKGHCGDFTQSLMELGAMVCVPNGTPNCDICPVQSLCCAYKTGTQADFPKRAAKRPRKTEHHTVFLIRCGDKYAIKKRKQKGLLAGMWEFPNTPGALTKEQAADHMKQCGMIVTDLVYSSKRKHIFTHIEWHMICYGFTVEQENDAFVWVSKDTLFSQVALPTAFRQFCELL